MRFKIILERTKNDILPIDYQYAFASWIYKTIHTGNSDFAEWLHAKGYTSGNRKFKLFCFSRLFFKFNGMKDRIQILSKEADFQISFVAEKTVEPFIIGLFQNQMMTLGDTISKVEFCIKSIEKVAEPNFSTSKAQFITKNPICISALNAEKNTPTYLSPENKDYASYLKSNLVNKYLSLYPETNLQGIPFEFRLLNHPYSKLITICKGEPRESKVRGFLYSFELSTTKELLTFAYDSGFGEKNSMGFGFVDKA